MSAFDCRILVLKIISRLQHWVVKGSCTMITALFGQQLTAAKGNSTCSHTATQQQRPVCIMENIFVNI
jgi:hypothetical protein